MANRASGVMASVLQGLRKIALQRAPAGTQGSPPPDASSPTHVAPTHVAATTDASLAGVMMEYRPDIDGDPDPGEVVWTWVPWEEDPTQGKDRPVVLIGRRGSMLVGVPLTSKRHDNEPQVAIGTGPWDHDGRPSYVKLDRILDVDPAQVRREGAILPRKRFDEIVTALRR